MGLHCRTTSLAIMDLYLSNNSPRNAVLTTAEGLAMYKMETPKKLGLRTTTVSKIVPNEKEDDLQDNFAYLAQIEWPVFARDKLRFQREKVVAKSYLKGDGFLHRRVDVIACPAFAYTIPRLQEPSIFWTGRSSLQMEYGSIWHVLT
jgi:hypothetical protein